MNCRCCEGLLKGLMSQLGKAEGSWWGWRIGNQPCGGGAFVT